MGPKKMYYGCSVLQGASVPRLGSLAKSLLQFVLRLSVSTLLAQYLSETFGALCSRRQHCLWGQVGNLGYDRVRSYKQKQQEKKGGEILLLVHDPSVTADITRRSPPPLVRKNRL